MTDFLSKNKKELRLLADYAYKGKITKAAFINKIYWEDDKLYATCGQAMLYMTADINPNGFTLMNSDKNKISVVTDQKEIEKQKSFGLYKKVIDRFSQCDFSFDFVWDKDLPLPYALAGSKTNRHKDKIYFNFEMNELELCFNEYEDEDAVKVTYKDLFQNMKGENPGRRFHIKYWQLFDLLRAEKKNKIHCELGRSVSSGDEIYFMRMTSDKYTCVVVEN